MDLNPVSRIIKRALSLLSVFMLTCMSVAYSQSPKFENYTTQDGLPSNEIYHMFQDGKGIMWFATDRGICTFDGYSFKSYSLDDGLPDDVVFKFFPQENGYIWCTTMSGKLFYFQPDNPVFTSYEYNELISDKAAGGITSDVLIDSKGKVYLSFKDREGVLSIAPDGKVLTDISKIKGDNAWVIAEIDEKGKSLAYVSNKPETFLKNSFASMAYCSTDEIWGNYMSERKGKSVLINVKNAVHFFPEKGDTVQVHSDNRIILSGFYGEKKFWIGEMEGGVSIYNYEGRKLNTYLKDNSVTRIYEDHEGGVWITTLSNGVFYSKGLGLKYYLLHDNPISKGLYLNTDQELSILTLSGKEYVYRDHRILEDEPHLHSEWRRIMYTTPWSSEAEKKAYWKQLNNYRNISFKGSSLKLTIHPERDALAPGFKSFFTIGPDSVTNYDCGMRVFDACWYGDEVICAGHNGLYKYDFNRGEKSILFESKVSTRVNDIDAFGKYIASATNGQGVIIFNGESHKSIDKTNGLSSNYVNEVLVQNDSVIWACTRLGVNQIIFHQDDSYSIASIGAEDGLADTDILDVVLLEDTLWLATRLGLVSVSSELVNSDNNTPSYFLSFLEAKVMGEEVVNLSKLTHEQNKIEFSFRAISFKRNKDLVYRYRLDGLSDDWNLTTDTKVLYESIPPGVYTFMVQAGVRNQWSEKVIEIPLIIRPPFYKSVWFIVLVIISVVLLIYLFFRYRVLSYNREIIRELLRQILKRLKKKNLYFIVKSKGKDIKVNSDEVLYAKSQGNYVELFTESQRIVLREKISNFESLVPDPLEYIRISRFCIVRIDKITEKGVDHVMIGDEQLRTGQTYSDSLAQLDL